MSTKTCTSQEIQQDGLHTSSQQQQTVTVHYQENQQHHYIHHPSNQPTNNITQCKLYIACSEDEHNPQPAHLAARLAVQHGVRGEAIPVLEVGEGFDRPPGLQVAGHADRRPHLQAVVNAGLRHLAAVQRLVLGLHTWTRTHTYTHIHPHAHPRTHTFHLNEWPSSM